MPDDPPVPGSLAEWLGEGGTAALADDWTRRCLADPALRHVLGHLGPAQVGRMVAYHRAYLADLLGGPSCHARELDEAHAMIGIDRAAFDRTRAHLREALRAARCDGPPAARILSHIAALAPLVVTRRHA
jgi:truncated hemoglobin YjbI